MNDLQLNILKSTIALLSDTNKDAIIQHLEFKMNEIKDQLVDVTSDVVLLRTKYYELKELSKLYNV